MLSMALLFFQVVVFFPNNALLGDAWLIEDINFTLPVCTRCLSSCF
jgi:hypothetical protein